MQMSDRTKAFLEKMMTFGQDPRENLGDLETGFRHSNYYHKYFQGYTEIRSVKPNGKIGIERRYTAPWIQHQLDTKQWVLTKVSYVLGVLASTILFLLALVQRIPSNTAAIVAAPGMLTVILVLLMWMSVCAYVTAPRKMTRWQYQSGKKKVELFTRLTSVGILLTAAMKVVYLCVWASSFWGAEIPGLLELLASVIPLVLMYLREHKMEYQEIENDTLVTEEERYQIW